MRLRRRPRFPIWYVAPLVLVLGLGLWIGGLGRTSSSSPELTQTPAPVVAAAQPTDAAKPTEALPPTPKPAPPVATPVPPSPTRVPPSATPAPPAATPLPPVTPTPAAIILDGRVPTDPPGYKLDLGMTVSSILDSNSKKRDLYEIDLQPGQTVQVLLRSDSGYGAMIQSKQFGSWSTNVMTFSTNERKQYTSATAEKYTISIMTTRSGVRYVLTVEGM